MASISQPAKSNAQPAIQTMPSQSNFISALEYDTANLTLTTHMKNGAIYQHKFVLPSEWTALQTSQNHGKLWSDTIRSKKMHVKIKSAKSPRSEIKTGRKRK